MILGCEIEWPSIVLALTTWQIYYVTTTKFLPFGCSGQIQCSDFPLFKISINKYTIKKLFYIKNFIINFQSQTFTTWKLSCKK